MEYRRLGHSGVKVSEISLGSWLTYGGYVEAERARACIARAYESGITFFDTANVYRTGEAERVVGAALAAYERSSYVLATKVFFPMGEGPNDRGLSRKHIREQIDASLMRLGVDYVDLLQCHRFDRETPIEETLRALDDAVSAGKVLYVGVSEWTAEQISEAREIQSGLLLDPLVSNQPQYSALYRRIERDVIPTCARLGIGQVVWSPLAQGVLTGKYRPGAAPEPGTRAADPQAGSMMTRFMTEPILEAVQGLVGVAKEAGLSMTELALAWTLREPNVSSAIIGASNPDHVEAAVGAAGVTLDDDTLAAVDRALAPVLDGEGVPR